MVFETLVTEVLNRFLGSYIENLDTKQLNIGIWGGDVVLTNLTIRNTAISDLNLPIKLYWGHLGKLTLKIPWKNLYAAPVIATVENLFVLLLPNSVIKYDEKAEEKYLQDVKQKELEKIEEAKKKTEENKNLADAKKSDTFVEKLVSQIIKNLQIKITGIHIRYEDSYSNIQKPFAFGVTLNFLSFDTTDENWKPRTVTDAVKFIFKIVRLDSLAIYWNSSLGLDGTFLNLSDKGELMDRFLAGIARSRLNSSFSSLTQSPQNQTSDNALNNGLSTPIGNHNNEKLYPPGYNYILLPLTSLAQLRLNPKPELDGTNFTTPKVLFNLIIQSISFAISQDQYHDILELLESIETLNLKSKYRKYRPHLQTYKDHYAEWWKFAITCVLEGIVQPRLRQWSWKHISAHRELVKRYIEAYKVKLVSKKLSPGIKSVLDNAERKLDVFNITLARQKAKLEVQREQILNHPTGGTENSASKGWFGGFFSRWNTESPTQASYNPSTVADTSINKSTNLAEGIASKFNEAMTVEEKAKLYQAIDYTETGVPPEYPPEFVQNVLHFKLLQLSLTLLGKESEGENAMIKITKLAYAALSELAVTVEQCPGADALQVELTMDNFDITGKSVVDQPTTPNYIIKTMKSVDDTLVHCLFEMNPLDKSCDQRLHLNANPLQIIYDADTINELSKFFKAPESVKLKQIQNAAVSTFEDVKQNTATGYKYALEKRKNIDLKIAIKSSHLIIPYGGVYKDKNDLLIIDLGNFSMQSFIEGQEEAMLTSGGGGGTSPRQSFQTPQMSYDTAGKLSFEQDDSEGIQDNISLTSSSKNTNYGDNNREEIAGLLEKSYDKIRVSMERIQFLYANAGEDWMSLKQREDSPLHILKPGTITVLLEKAIIMDDPNLPKIRIFGVLPDLTLNISDQRLENMLKLLLSIPLPTENEPTVKTPTTDQEQTDVVDDGSMSEKDKTAAYKLTQNDIFDQQNEMIERNEDSTSLSSSNSPQNIQLTSLVANFDLRLLCINLYRVTKPSNSDVPTGKNISKTSEEVKQKLMCFQMQSLGTFLEVKSFQTRIKAHLKALTLQNFEYSNNNTPLYLIKSMPNNLDKYFLTSEIIMADINGPDFVYQYNNVEKNIRVQLSPLIFRIHEQAILNILQMWENLQKEMNKHKKNVVGTTAVVKQQTTPSNTSLSHSSKTTSAKRSSVIFRSLSMDTSSTAVRKARKTIASIPPLMEEESSTQLHSAVSNQAPIYERKPHLIDIGTVVNVNNNKNNGPPMVSPSAFSSISQSGEFFTPPSSLRPDDSNTSVLKTFQSNLKQEPLIMYPRKNKNGDEIIDILLNINIQSIAINVCNVGGDIATTYINGLKSNIHMMRNKMDIAVELFDLLIKDLTNYKLNTDSTKDASQIQYHRQILSSISKEQDVEPLIKGNITMFNNGPGNSFWVENESLFEEYYREHILYDMSRMDMSVTLQVRGIRIVVFVPFLLHLQGVLESLCSSETRNKMMEASTAAAVEMVSSFATSAAVTETAPPFEQNNGSANQNTIHTTTTATTTTNQKCSSRILLRIEMKAPLFVIPQSNVSNEAAMVDLGTLKIKNKFITMTEGMDSTHPSTISLDNNNYHSAKSSVILDKMMIELSDFKLSRILVDDRNATKIRSEVLILEPANVSLEVRRNLMFDFVPQYPQIDVTGHLTKSFEGVSAHLVDSMSGENVENNYSKIQGLEVGISEEDLQSLMKILNDNIFEYNRQQAIKVSSSEKATLPTHKPIVLTNSPMTLNEKIAKRRKTSLLLSPKLSTDSFRTNNINAPTPSVVADNAKVVTKTTSTIRINFKFQFDKIGASLYYGSSNLGKGGICSREEKKAFSSIQILFIHLQGHINSDDTLETQISIYNLILEDKRPSMQNGITKMIEMHKGLAISEDEQPIYATDDISATAYMTKKELLIQERNRQNHLINIYFKRDATNNMTINAALNRLYVCVCVDFLMSVSDFFTKNMPKKPEENAANKSIVASLRLPDEPKKEFVAPIVTSSIFLSCSINDPEFLLIENPTDINTKALLLSFHLYFLYNQNPEKTIMDGKLHRLQMKACPFPTHLRAENSCQILNPLNIDLMCDSLTKSGQRINVNISDIVLNISPATIRVLTAAISLKGPTKPVDNKEELLSLPTDMWTIKDLDNCDFWFLRTEICDEAIEQMDFEGRALAAIEKEQNEKMANLNQSISEDDTIPYFDQLTIAPTTFCITIEAGIDNRTVPMLKLQSVLMNANLQDWSHGPAMKAFLKLSLEAAYYNEYLAIWEPLIEPLVHYGDSSGSIVKSTTEKNSLGTPNEPNLEDKYLVPWKLSVSMIRYREIANAGLSPMGGEYRDNLTPTPGPQRLPSYGGGNGLSRLEDEIQNDNNINGSNNNNIPSTMQIDISSKSALNMTLTKCCLQTLNNLSTAFGDAVNQKEPQIKGDEQKAPFILLNQLGIDINVECDKYLGIKIKNEKVQNATLENNHKLYIYPLTHTDTISTISPRSGNALNKASPHYISILDSGRNLDYFLKLKFPLNGFVNRIVGINQVRKSYFEIPISSDAARKLSSASTQSSASQQATRPFSNGIICDVISQNGTKHITIQTPVKIVNNFSIPMEIYVLQMHEKTAGSVPKSSLVKLVCLESNANWSIPISIINSNLSRFYFKPSSLNYDISKDGIDWNNTQLLANNPLKYVISCPALSDIQEEPFYISITEIIEPVFGTCINETQHYLDAETKTFFLMPTVSIINLLPYKVTQKLQSSRKETEIMPGTTAALYNACIGKSQLIIKIADYVERNWSCVFPLQSGGNEFQVISFTASSKSHSGKYYNLDIGFHCMRTKGMLQISIFSPYWIINQTGLTLYYQQADSVLNASPYKKDRDEETSTIEHKPTFKFPLLFSFKPKSLFSKKKVCLRVVESDWSEKFSLDTIGSSGVVSCKTKDSSFEIGVDIVLSKTSYTKIVTFFPYYTLKNNAQLDILYKEYFVNQPNMNKVQAWHTIKSGECSPLWPKQAPNNKNMALVAKFPKSEHITIPFPINRANSTLLKLDNTFGGINAECHVSESGITITLDQYFEGQAVVLLINHTSDDTFTFHQSGTKEYLVLQPQRCLLYTWQDALFNERILVWECGEKKNQKLDLLKDSFGEFFIAQTRSKIYWVSFLDGLQRTLLFTEDMALIYMAQQAGQLENMDQEIVLSLESLSLSLVDNIDTMCEICYISMQSTGTPNWEITASSLTVPNSMKETRQSFSAVIKNNKVRKYKSLKPQEALLLEHAYQIYLDSLSNESMSSANNLTTPQIIANYNNVLATVPNNIFSKSGLILDLDNMAFIKLKSNNLNNLSELTDISYYYGLRRSFRPSVWIQYRASIYQLHLHLKLHKLQIDDQLMACTFPVVFGIFPVSKSISDSSPVSKPLIELSLFKRNSQHGGIPQIKYFKVLMQEMFLRADQGFIDNIVTFFTQPIATSLTSSNQDELSIHESYETDIKAACQDMVRVAADKAKTSTGPKIYYEYLHFSPIKIHLSFSLQNTKPASQPGGTLKEEKSGNIVETGRSQSPLPLSRNSNTIKHSSSMQSGSREFGRMSPSPSPLNQSSMDSNRSSGNTTNNTIVRSAAFNFLLQSIGVTLADIDDVVFKLGYFERTYRFYTQSQLVHEVTKHYVAQALKQMYVLVLGLDVLGNPFGLIRGFTEGMGDLFYEPYQGAIQGPEEFAQGLAFGVRSLFGHTVGGAAGAVSRITGTLGKGIAALTLDQDYQKSRREDMNKKPSDLKEGVARGGKGLVMGFYEGLTGVVKKPLEGAKQEGASGFIKGFGKGLVGVVARPTSGVVDFASSSFQGIKRFAEQSEDIHRLRPRRIIHRDGIVRPYDFNEAEGYEIFRAVEKGHLDQKYMYHAFLSSDLKDVLIMTNENIFLISKGELFGQWVIDWSYSWTQFTRRPVYLEKLNGIRIDVKGESRKKRCMSAFLPTEDNNYRIIPIKNRTKAEKIIGKINEILKTFNL